VEIGRLGFGPEAFVRNFARELLIYQLVAVVLTLLSHPGSEFLPNLPAYLIMTNCIAWSIHTIFCLVSLRFDFITWKRRWQVLFGFPIVAAGCFIGVLIALQIFRIVFHQHTDRPLLFAIFRGALPAAIIVTIFILSYYTVRERMQSHAVERERLKRLQARAELAALQSKLDPHFLFNTLNTMVNLVHKEPDKLEQMILGLSDIYRRVLKLPSADRITLSEEFDLARQYLAIEQVRLGDRLRYEIQLPDNLRDRTVPPLLIQPLVENAVIHGIMPAPGGGCLSLSAQDYGDRIRVVVEDDGVGMDSRDANRGAEPDDDRGPMEEGPGFGLHSTRERLRLTYAGMGAMKIESIRGQGTRITLELPDEH
jgi:two-component system LytT family sensor kinase